MPTYLSKYEDALLASMAKGGSEADIERAISEYNKTTRTRLQEWARSAGLTCDYCDNPAITEDVRPTDEVTCLEHKS